MMAEAELRARTRLLPLQGWTGTGSPEGVVVKVVRRWIVAVAAGSERGIGLQ